LTVSRHTRLFLLGILLAGHFFSGVVPCPAQTPAVATPATVLRDAMLAACSQHPDEFRRALTSRNAAAFSRIAPTARTTFLKRFVLLDKPGQSHSENTSNDTFLVSCSNSDITTQIQIGKTELRDNLAYLPFEIKDASDSAGAASRRVTIGMVRENGEWKLLSLGLLLLDLPSLEEEWDRAEIQANEKLAIAYLKQIAEAVETYRKTYTRLPDTLAVLGPPLQGTAKSDKASLISEELAAGRKDGFVFRYVIVGANNSGAPAKYELAAIPAEYGRSGTRSFFRDSSGSFHAADRQGSVGSEIDPKLE
jgi:hypothetical protein